jgi:ABC-type polysaccharide/polyol phosphate transport system ATPase subunit
MAAGAKAIEVRNLSKVFRIPTNRVLTLKHRALHPRERQGYRALRALDHVSFEVGQGEFFGIVGRNGSGKSTLLKLIASIYRADAGTIRVAGRMAPFIELGVGFNPELSAYDNVVLNGVMMGLTPREARKRYDQVIEFAELQEFTELKLRNYSSGMRVRLAFAVMVQVDADVMLIDEVLAVGDEAFQQSCAETFVQLIQRGKTIVLVTHAMGALRNFCDRALLLEDGRIDMLGNPEEVATRYSEVNFAQQKQRRGLRTPGQPRVARREPLRLARVTDAWIESAEGERTRAVARREPIELRAEIELDGDLDGACFGLELWAAGGRKLFAPASIALGQLEIPRASERLIVAATIENRLSPGRYRLNCGVTRREPDGGERPASEIQGVAFKVAGEKMPGSVLDLAHEAWVEPAMYTEVVRG